MKKQTVFFCAGFNGMVFEMNTNPKMLLKAAVNKELPVFIVLADDAQFAKYDTGEITLSLFSADIVRAIGNAVVFDDNMKPFCEALDIMREERKFLGGKR